MAMLQIIEVNEHETFDDLGKFYTKLLPQQFNSVIEVFDRCNSKKVLKEIVMMPTKNMQCSCGRPVQPFHVCYSFFLVNYQMLARISFTNTQLNHYYLVGGDNGEEAAHITSEGT